MFDLFCLSFRNIFRKGLRAALTMVGIAVGVASVMLINTIGDVGVKTVNAELDSLGLGGISVSSGKCLLNNRDLDIIKQQNGVCEAMPILTNQSKIALNGMSHDVMIWGVDSGVKQVISVKVLYGRAFEKYDVEAKENVCMIDENVAKILFKRQNVVGKSVSLQTGSGYEDFEIIGVTEAGSGILQSIMGNIVPNFCYIPYTTFQQSIYSDEIYQVAVQLDNDASAKQVSKSIKSALDTEKGVNGSVKTGDLAAGRDTLSGLLDTITVIFSVIGIISLLVAGLGIMTVMLVSVNERTREIGIKKAIGARFTSVMTEFLFEALTICVIGSIIGSVLGYTTIFIGGKILGMDINVKPSTVIFSFLSAVITGVIFGLYPAYKAAKMKPVDALRCD